MMKDIKNMLAGIGIILSSIVCFLIAFISNWTLLNFLGIILAIIGNIFIFAGLFDNQSPRN